MSFNVTWDLEKYREEHESEDHWLLRKAFMEKWKNNYPEERLICLARVFSNIEFMGCRYPSEVMKEVATLSKEVANTYRDQKKTKLQRTFVSASDAAEDRAKGIKREGGIIKDAPQPKSTRINFVKQGESSVTETEVTEIDSDNEVVDPNDVEIYVNDKQKDESSSSGFIDATIYLNELLNLKCADIRRFRDSMFDTCFGRLVLLVRPWTGRLSNIQASCQACHIPLQSLYDNHMFSISLNGRLLAEGRGDTKQTAKVMAETLAWDRIKTQVISVLVKEQWIAQGDARIAVSDVSGNKPANDTFGTPIESSVASKMMQMMGWKGGGLGADAQGIEEPIKPHLQMVNRAGLGSSSSDIRQIKRAGQDLMRRYIASASLDVDLVFSSDFSKEERAALHQCAQKSGLASRSYGADADRFLVVKKKLNPFSIVKGVIEEGGNTAKYQVFIPIALSRNNGR